MRNKRGQQSDPKGGFSRQERKEKNNIKMPQMLRCHAFFFLLLICICGISGSIAGLLSSVFPALRCILVVQVHRKRPELDLGSWILEGVNDDSRDF